MDTLRQAFKRRALSKQKRESVQVNASDEHPPHDVTGPRMDRPQIANVTINDQARVQLGDTYHVYNAPKADSTTYTLLYESLAFPNMHARIQNVTSALPSTCEWLLEHQLCFGWTWDRELSSELLWIKGKPGSGKSTLMREFFLWFKHNKPSHINLCYFFNARAPSELEKSPLGLYRSLTHQLLSKFPNHGRSFELTFETKDMYGTIEPWQSRELQNFLTDAFPNTPTQINIFIDALDEGNEDEVREMLKFFERFIKARNRARRNVRICFASRHYPSITIPTASEIIVENEAGHQQVIAHYIQEELHGSDDSRMHQVRLGLLERAAGVFLWVVLVVDILNEAYDHGTPTPAILKKLQEIPREVGDVFGELLRKDPSTTSVCLNMLRRVLFAFEPLTLRQLYVAVNTDGVCSVSDGDFPTEDMLRKWLVTGSRGLLDLTRPSWGDDPVTVQVIHETVRDYMKQSSDPHQTKNNGHVSLTAEPCHMYLAERCVQILADLCRARTTPVDHTTLESCPVGQYAAALWCQHLRNAGPVCRPQIVDNLVTFLSSASYDCFTWFPSASSSVTPDPRASKLPWALDDYWPSAWTQMSERQDFCLALVASSGAQSLIHEMHRHGFDDVTPRTEGFAIRAAAIAGHERAVKLLLQKNQYMNPQAVYARLLEIAARYGDEWLTNVVIAAGFDFDESLTLFSFRDIIYGIHIDLMKMVLDAGADIDTHIIPEGSMLNCALRLERLPIAQLLLERGTNIDARSFSDGNQALHFAAATGELSMVRALLARGAVVDSENNRGCTALMLASEANSYQSVEALLQAGADIYVRDRDERTVLHAALSARRDKSPYDVLRTLLQAGAASQVNKKDYQGRTPLHLAVEFQKSIPETAASDIIKLLCSVGADLKATNHLGQTAFGRRRFGVH